MASTVKAMGVPVTTDWLSGCRVILGGSTVKKDLMTGEEIAMKLHCKNACVESTCGGAPSAC